ncbi:MAG: DUF4838 domain-containing protein [Bacteroidaceae bacterium]|nr:DUF4838 domain-containing protein [Bacteroidaceae bacterium]
MHPKQVLLLLIFSCQIAAGSAASLFKNGKTDYTIVIARNASQSEQTAAKELQLYLKQISDADFPLSNNLNHTGKAIFIGHNNRTAQLTGTKKPSNSDEGFTYQTVGDNLVIIGGRNRGTMYGVFSFLENELGVRWYTADFTKVPRLKTFQFHELARHEQPFIPYRYTLYYHCADDKRWAAHNKNNFQWSLQRNEYGGSDACLGAHTMPEYIPENLYNEHPEYFALRSGKRVADGQRCLSNTEVLRLTIDAVLRRIKDHPDYLFYDVSQDDNKLYCECDKCREIENRYGGTHAGLIIWFVNQVAEAVDKVHPEARLGTLAYGYTRKAPTGIKPHKNITIRLCDIECCFAHPLEQCEKNVSFMEDLQAWSALTDNLYIWDYVVNYSHYINPYPNFAVLGRNIQTFGRFGAQTVLELGQRHSPGGEFGDMKAWVIARLLWNPQQDINQLTTEFIRDYYGKAAPYIQAYYDMCQRKVDANRHLYQKTWIGDDFFSDKELAEARRLFNKAMDKASTEDIRTRVADVEAQVLYLQTLASPTKSRLDGTEVKLIRYLQKRKAYTREWETSAEFLEGRPPI